MNHGTHLGWFIDPEEKNVIIFQPGQQPVALEESIDRLIMLPVLEEWSLTVTELFDWLTV